MEGVEEEVGVELHLERFEPRLRQLRLQLRGERFALPVPLAVVEGVADAEQGPVDEEVEEEQAAQLALELVEEGPRVAPHVERPDDYPQASGGRDVGGREDE